MSFATREAGDAERGSRLLQLIGRSSLLCPSPPLPPGHADMLGSYPARGSAEQPPDETCLRRYDQMV